jgi:hypothetical protein
MGILQAKPTSSDPSSNRSIKFSPSTTVSTNEEIDFIINYDIKYRIGQNNGSEDE